jgi:hypothetical protein
VSPQASSDSPSKKPIEKENSSFIAPSDSEILRQRHDRGIVRSTNLQLIVERTVDASIRQFMPAISLHTKTQREFSVPLLEYNPRSGQDAAKKCAEYFSTFWDFDGQSFFYVL